MDKILGWLIIFPFFILGVIVIFTNTTIATLGLISGLVLGSREGFDAATIFLCSLFGFLLAVEYIGVWLTKSERILSSTPPNLILAVNNLAWLALAALLFYGLFGNGALVKYFFTYLTAAILISVANVIGMIFHATLCVSKARKYLSDSISRAKDNLPRTA